MFDVKPNVLQLTLLSPLFSNDKRFFLKTQSKREVRFLLSNLRIYIEHLEKYPHSLLVKFLGENLEAGKLTLTKVTGLIFDVFHMHYKFKCVIHDETT